MAVTKKIRGGLGPRWFSRLAAGLLLPPLDGGLAAPAERLSGAAWWSPLISLAAITAAVVFLLVALHERRRAVTERKLGDARNRVLRTVHAVHQLVERERDPQRLLERVCAILAEHGGFVMAWVGVASPDGRVVPRAAAGRDTDYLETVEIRYDNSPMGRGPTGTALREKRTIIAQDWRADDTMRPWLEQGALRGYRSSLATPIRTGETEVAVLSVYHGQPDAFDGETLALLEELAGDLGLALQAIAQEAAHREADAALRESHRALLESQRVARVGSYRLDVRTGRWESSAVLDELFGIVTDDHVKDVGGWLAIVHPDDRDEMESYLQHEVLRGGRPFDREYRIRRLSDGGERWVWGRGRLVRGADGRAAEMLGTILDVTEHRRTEERLRESIGGLEDANEKLRLLVEGSSHYFFYLQDLEGDITFVSPSVAGITGRPVEAWLGQSHWWTTDNPLNDTARAVTARHLAGELDGEPVAVEIRHADGRPILLEIFESGRFRGGRLIGLQGVAHDITERRRTDEALRRSEERYRRFFERDLTANFITHRDGTIVECNPTFVRIFGFADRAEALAANAVDLFPAPDDREEFLALLTTQPNLEYHEVELRRRDGAPLHVIANLVAELDGRGEVVSITGYLMDVTQRRNLEDQLRQAQKMEAVGRLAGGVAHDFNNLLQAMLSQIQLVQSTAFDPARLIAVTAELEQQVHRGAALTRQLLLFSRRETTRRLRLDLNEVVEGQAAMLRRLVRENIAVRLELATEPLPVVADHGQLEQVLMNLTVNASDALAQGGELAIRTGSGADGTVWLCVEDDGPGIPLEIRDMVFEPFFTTKAAGEGTGLGLSVVLGIVTQHRGRVALSGREGGGTAVRVFLPRAREPDEPATDTGVMPRATSPHGSGERVLLVEDEPMARAGLAELLGVLRYEAVAVGSAEEAMELPPDPPFEVLLTDFMLPGRNGAELAGDLRARWPGLQVILMSGYAADESVRRAIGSGTMRFVQKPFDMRILAEELRECLDARAAAPPRQ